MCSIYERPSVTEPYSLVCVSRPQAVSHNHSDICLTHRSRGGVLFTPRGSKDRMPKYFVSLSVSPDPTPCNILEATTVWGRNPAVRTWYTPDWPGPQGFTMIGPPYRGSLPGTLAGTLITAITACGALFSVSVVFQFRGTESHT